MAAASYFRHELYTPTRADHLDAVRHLDPLVLAGPGYSSWSAGENLAWGAPASPPSETVSRWMASPGHRANILNPALAQHRRRRRPRPTTRAATTPRGTT